MHPLIPCSRRLSPTAVAAWLWTTCIPCTGKNAATRKAYRYCFCMVTRAWACRPDTGSFLTRRTEFVAQIPPAERSDLLQAFARRLFSDDPAASLQATRAWGRYEGSCLHLLPPPEVADQFGSDAVALGVGRYDAVCPALSAWRLHETWPQASFEMIEDAGHAAFARALVAPTERFRLLGRPRSARLDAQAALRQSPPWPFLYLPLPRRSSSWRSSRRPSRRSARRPGSP